MQDGIDPRLKDFRPADYIAIQVRSCDAVVATGILLSCSPEGDCSIRVMDFCTEFLDSALESSQDDYILTKQYPKVSKMLSDVFALGKQSVSLQR